MEDVSRIVRIENSHAMRKLESQIKENNNMESVLNYRDMGLKKTANIDEFLERQRAFEEKRSRSVSELRQKRDRNIDALQRKAVGDPMSMINKIEDDRDRREEKLARMREERNNDKECTFHPKINSTSVEIAKKRVPFEQKIREDIRAKAELFNAKKQEDRDEFDKHEVLERLRKEKLRNSPPDDELYQRTVQWKRRMMEKTGDLRFEQDQRQVFPLFYPKTHVPNKKTVFRWRTDKGTY